MIWFERHILVCGYFQVSSYGLFVEDVVGVSEERVVVEEAAASRIQRLTKVNGCWWVAVVL